MSQTLVLGAIEQRRIEQIALSFDSYAVHLAITKRRRQGRNGDGDSAEIFTLQSALDRLR